MIWIKSFHDQVVIYDNGKPGWLKVWHLSAIPAGIGFILGLWF